MAAADHRRLDAEESKGRLEQAAGNLRGDRDLANEGTADRTTSGVEQNVDRVAGKVKGLLRSRH